MVGLWDIDFGTSFGTDIEVLVHVFGMILKCSINDGFIAIL